MDNSENIVICCDGTGNKFCDRNTNVVKLYSVLDLSDPTSQVAYYHGGLGTLGAPAAITRLLKLWTKTKGLAFGYGLTRDIGDAYNFLMDNYEEGDRVYLFGFSRGAYTVRALSGMLHMLGLIRKGDDNLIAYASDMLKRPDQMKIARAFKKTFSESAKFTSSACGTPSVPLAGSGIPSISLIRTVTPASRSDGTPSPLTNAAVTSARISGETGTRSGHQAGMVRRRAF